MRRFTRAGAAAASVALAVTGLAAVAPSAQAAPPQDPAGIDTGAAWLTGQLTNGIIRNNQFAFDDYGLSIDVAFALDAVGGHATTVQSVATALAGHIDAYTKFGAHEYAGSLAKLGVLADLVGDPTSFGSRNLVTEVNALVATTAPNAGRLQDAGTTTTDTDTANTIGQAYATRLLDNNGGGQAANAETFLLDQQCSNGGFRLTLDPATSTTQNCTDPTKAQIDATAITLLQLKAITSPSAAVTTAITDATTFLVDKQQSTGAWGGDPGGSAANANSTGLASWALGSSSQSTAAAQWLRNRQVTYFDLCDALKNSRGAVAYDDTALTTGRKNGITTATTDQFRRATAQALPALQYLAADPTPAAPQLTGPTGYAKGGGTASFRVTGVNAGDQLCLTGGPGGAGGTATGTTFTTSARLFNLTGSRTFTVRDREGHGDSVVVRQLGSKSLKLTRSHLRNKRSHFATITIYGLAPGEHATLRFRGALKGSGTANSAGVFRRSIWTGRKLGTGTVAGYGQFGDIRKGYTKIKVVR